MTHLRSHCHTKPGVFGTGCRPNQARLQREARLHQQELDNEKRVAAEASDTSVLLAALRAELAALHLQAANASEVSENMAKLYEKMAKENIKSTLKTIRPPSFRASIYEANIPRLGLLGVSLAADVVAVATMAQALAPWEVEGLSPKYIEMLYLTHSLAMRHWKEDLYHVAMRIRSKEEGTPDPGILSDMRIKRRTNERQDVNHDQGLA